MEKTSEHDEVGTRILEGVQNLEGRQTKRCTDRERQRILERLWTKLWSGIILVKPLWQRHRPKRGREKKEERKPVPPKYQALIDSYSKKPSTTRGTMCRCIHCGAIARIRLKKNTKLKVLFCFGCGQRGFERYTVRDQLKKSGVIKKWKLNRR